MALESRYSCLETILLRQLRISPFYFRMDKITTDLILKDLQSRVENKQVQFDAAFWIETSMKLNLLLGDEYDLLFKLQQDVANLKIMWLDGQEKKNVSETKLRVEGSDEYRKMKTQEAKCKRIEEFIRISKKFSDRASGF